MNGIIIQSSFSIRSLESEQYSNASKNVFGFAFPKDALATEWTVGLFNAI